MSVMILIKTIFILFILPSVDVKIYVFNTADSPSTEVYDCILHEGLFYCRRPTDPMALNRSNDTMQFCHNGTVHYFSDLRQNNVSFSTILHYWKSGIEKVEQYLRYVRNESEPDEYVCHCTDKQSFGKNCEYLLSTGITFAEALAEENLLKKHNPQYVQFYADIICYTTLECNSGLLCLDWRDICDGVQQCMSGLDEDNCDKLEFNECENDEYRCMNGMCIPEEYFLDAEFDCLDWSDEIQYYDDASCSIEAASIQCDDRICPPNQFSCGDGQCILDRFQFQTMPEIKSECRSRREQYFICETHHVTHMWTLPNGRCYEAVAYNQSKFNNRTTDEECLYIFRCDLSGTVEAHCPCRNDSCYNQQLNDTCHSPYIQYPKGGIMAPYILFFYPTYYKLTPDFILINGTIKCDGNLVNISGIQFEFNSKLRHVEDAMCKWAKNNSLIDNDGTNERCHRHSSTFNNRSYSLTDVCNKSKKCISTYRIKDGFENCADKMDEKANISITTICSKMQRYRFRCYTDELACLSVTALGNLQNDCKNTFDELWLGTSTRLADISCNKQWKDQCEILRQYINNSWILNNTNEVTKYIQIPFRHYCDTFWNLVSKEDENPNECQNWWICPEEQWRCDNGQCIDVKWVLDGEWDCADASDEHFIFDRLIKNRSLQEASLLMLTNRYTERNKSIPFSTICNLARELPCFPVNFSNSLDNLIHSRPCINRQYIGDGHIDCYGAIDERNTMPHCNQLTMLGYNYKCQSTNRCIPYWNYCFDNICNTPSDDLFWCNHQQSKLDYDEYSDSVCSNGTRVNNSRCNRIPDCSFGEDEYMCEYRNISKVSDAFYRRDKEVLVKNTQQNLRLPRFPFDASITVPTANLPTIPPVTQTQSRSLNNTAPLAYWCNRGVSVKMSNGSIGCFCPPQYYGDKCQFHTDRITILFHLDLSQSIYTMNSDINIVLKIIVLFLFHDKIITNHIFHARAVTELSVITKRTVHLLYSHSLRHPQHKIHRYFNQSGIVNDHPYSVRIEMYERMNSGEPLLIAVWKYPVYFDYLPVFRIAKILRLTKLNTNEKNPCLSNPCNQNEDCQPLMNDKSKHICLCKNNFTGENCSIKDDQCANGYCFPGSICKPDYQGVLIGNQLPYCICPFDYFGDQCNIRHDQCSRTPCQHNGTCYTGSKPDSISCICTDEYYGRECQYIKPAIKLYINESVHHVGAVVQYFDIDFISLNLKLVRQQVYQILPTVLEYLHDQKTAPEIILVKLYLSHMEVPAELYLISVQINVTTISATTQLMEKNRCIHLHTLISDNQTQITTDYSPIKYHYLCRNNTNLLCFRDDFYLCICDENHSRVECFRYDLELDQCSHCLANGRCLKGDRSQSKKFICLCPPCYSGANCQFNSNSFTFTLDQLFFTDLISKIKRKTTLQLLIIIPLLLFLFALPNNFFSIITFCRQNCLRNGIGQYLLYMSVINQVNLGVLAGRLIHLSINIAGLHTHHSVDDYLCKILSYLLTSSSRIVYWLSSLIAIERVYMTVFLNGRWLRKPHIARRLIILTVIGILISDIHELIFVKSLFGIDNGDGGMCVIEFPTNYQSRWLLFHFIVSIMNSILPLLINLCCTITISCVVAKKKLNTRKTVIVLNIKTKEEGETSTKESRLTNFRARLRLVLNVLSENKELIIGPGITLVPQLFSLPLFVISFTLYCQNLESSWVRYLLITSYFTSFIPQLTSFMLYVIPSSFYSTEWQNTKINQWMFGFFRSTRSDRATLKISEYNGVKENDHLAKSG